jgi:hypothetical protein
VEVLAYNFGTWKAEAGGSGSRRPLSQNNQTKQTKNPQKLSRVKRKENYNQNNALC